MLDTASSRPPKLVTLSLAFLLAGLLGCSHGSQGEQPAGAKAAGSGQAPAAGAAAAPAAGAAPATPAAHDSTAPPAAAGAAAPIGAPAGQAPAPQALPQDKIPAVVAKVNGTPIPKGDLIKMADQYQAQVPAMTAGIYRQLLDQLISQELLRQEAKASGVTASDAEVNQQLGEIKGRYQSPDKYQEQLKKNGVTEADLVKQIRETMAMQKFVETKVVNDVTVSDQQVKTWYDQNQDKVKHPERVHVRHILVKVDKSSTPEDKKKAQAKADDLLAKLKAGADFSKLAEESSDDQGSKTRGGELPLFGRGQMVKPFEDAAFALKKPNEISPVVESQFGFHIIQLVERQDAGVYPLDEIKDGISRRLKQQQQQEKFLTHLKTLKDKAKVEIFI
jgi:peptidyl-prolyl cis-trans isomerase C